jgi:Capsule assembly protein Wzi
MIKGIAIAVAMAASNLAWANAPKASVPYTPSWQARHHLQQLSDDADLALPISHWPLPAQAVQTALEAVHPANAAQEQSLQFVRRELERHLLTVQTQLQLRSAAEGAGGYGQNYTPGSSFSLSSDQAEWQGQDLSFAGRVGFKVEESPNSLQTEFSGLGKEGRIQLRPENTAAVLNWGDVNLQAFSHQNWWGPGWQSSLINGHNSPAWIGLGLQRASVQRSESPWLSWLGPWTLEGFVARAQDPVVVDIQPDGYLYTGMRMTFKPAPWVEIGLSRAIQFGGSGRPSDINSFAKSLLGKNVNKGITDTFVDSSSQVAGFDLRVRCPAHLNCAGYAQFMGEDAAGEPIPLPYKFMSLVGIESTFASGRHRAFVEFVDSNINSLDNTGTPMPGMINGVYRQGYTNGARWIGSAFGGGSKVLTLGWLDAQAQRQIKLHSGKVFFSVGAFQPGTDAAHGYLHGLSASQSLRWGRYTVTPEIEWLQLRDGSDQRANKTESLRLGIALSTPLN